MRFVIKNSFPLFFAVLCGSGIAVGETTQKRWESNVDAKVPTGAVVQNRAIEKAGRTSWVLPSVGTSDRKDLYDNFYVSAGARYFFSETHGLEFARVLLNFPFASGLVNQIQNQTGFMPDSRQSNFSLGASYIYSPIYGKYAWNETSLVHLDAYFLFGGGIRFSNAIQPYGEVGIGSAQYLGTSGFAVVPEIRWRVYPESRSSLVIVGEWFFQVGVSWLL